MSPTNDLPLELLLQTVIRDVALPLSHPHSHHDTSHHIISHHNTCHHMGSPLIAQAVQAKQSHDSITSVAGIVTTSSATNAAGLTIRVLVPMAASGSLIGRGGSVIKQLNEASGCKIKLADIADPFKTEERIVIFQASSIPTLVKVPYMLG